MSLQETLEKISKEGRVIAVILFIMLLISLAFFLQGLLIYLAYNYLVLWVIPTLPVISYFKACVVGVILGFIRSFFKKY